MDHLDIPGDVSFDSLRINPLRIVITGLDGVNVGDVLLQQPQLIVEDEVQVLGVVVPPTVVFEDAELLARYVRLRHIAEPRFLYKAISQMFVDTVELASHIYHTNPSLPKLCIRERVSDSRIWLKRIR